jgi:hypothetical protein
VIAFFVSFSLGGSAIAGDTPAATVEVVVVVSGIFKDQLMGRDRPHPSKSVFRYPVSAIRNSY